MAQQETKSMEITNLVMVPDNFQDDDKLERVLNTMESHEGFLYMNKSESVMSPQGPTGYGQIIEVHWKSMEMMMAWAQKMEKEIPAEERGLDGVKILFYNYK